MEQAFTGACVEIRRIIFGLKDFSAASSDLFLNSKSLNNVTYLATKKHFDEKNMHKGMEVSNENTRITNKEYDSIESLNLRFVSFLCCTASVIAFSQLYRL